MCSMQNLSQLTSSIAHTPYLLGFKYKKAYTKKPSGGQFYHVDCLANV